MSGIMIAALAVIATVVLLRSTAGPTAGGPPNPARIESPFGSLVASDLELIINGRTYRVPTSAIEPGVDTLALVGAGDYGRLTILWRDGSTPLTLVIHFAANARTWWVSEIVATDGRAAQAGWLYFEGPLFERPLGTVFSGTVALASSRATYPETASLRFGVLELEAFGSSRPHDPTSGTMPPPGRPSPGVGSPDFVPYVGSTGSQIVGYVPIAELDQPVPINSLSGLRPDQPIYGPDLKTLVGYAVAGVGFQPLPNMSPSLAPPGSTTTSDSGPTISWDHPFQAEGRTVDVQAVVATPSAFGLAFVPTIPALQSGRLRWVDVSRSGTIAFMFDFAGDPRFTADARAQVEESRASMTEAEFLSIKWAGT